MDKIRNDQNHSKPPPVDYDKVDFQCYYQENHQSGPGWQQKLE